MEGKKQIRNPKQLRGKETKNNLIRAALKLFCEKGYYNTNSKEIAHEANVATGSFYAYFKDKKDVFIELINKMFEDSSLIYELIEIDNSVDINNREFFSNLVRNFFEVHNFPQEFHREVIILKHSDPEICTLITSKEKEIIDKIHQYLVEWRRLVKVNDLKAASLVIYSTIDNVIGMTKFSGIEINQDKVIDELTNLLLAYLF